MKKNVKYLGAAAAALLAVAPVVAPSISAGANNGVVQAAEVNYAVHVSAPTLTSKVSLATLTSRDSFRNAITITTGNGQAVSGAYANVNTVQLYDVTSSTPTLVTKDSQLVAGHQYKLKGSVTISGLSSKAGDTYKINGQSVTINPSGTTTPEVAIYSDAFMYINPDAQGVPYFSYMWNQYTNGEALSQENPIATSAYTNSTTGRTFTAQQLLTYFKNNVTFVPDQSLEGNGRIYQNQITTTVSDIEAQLNKISGITKNANGSYNIPNSAFNINFTGKASNGKTVTVSMAFAGNGKVQSEVPSFNYNGGARLTKNGEPTAEGKNLIVPVKQGDTKWQPTDGFAAYVNDTSDTKVNIFVASNNVNLSVPGFYNVTLKATNASGKSTSFTYTVRVLDAGQKLVDYVPGYNVLVWSFNGTGSNETLNYAQQTVKAGQAVSTFGTKTFNGVSYTRINGQGSNTWIQTQYLDGSWKNNANKPSTDSNKEEKMSGVIKVVYNGKGKVALTDANGHYGTGNYVAKNASFKVFAKKTINGRTFYRLGTQSQWIPAQYAEIVK